jgi:hypothetical protein
VAKMMRRWRRGRGNVGRAAYAVYRRQCHERAGERGSTKGRSPGLRRGGFIGYIVIPYSTARFQRP